MRTYVLDTSVLIHAIRSDHFRAELADWQRVMGPGLYQHAVVVAELLVGARTEAAWGRWRERWVLPAERVGRVITPGCGTWLRASRIVSRLAQGGSPASAAKPGFFNDCLLAASSREEGFVVVTRNEADFALIATVEPGLEVTPPLP